MSRWRKPKVWTCLGDSRSKPSRWLQSSVWRSTMDWTRGPGSCSSCGPPVPGPGTAWHSLETRSTWDRVHQSLSGTRCRCNTPARWIPRSRTEALNRGRGEDKTFWMKWGWFRSERKEDLIFKSHYLQSEQKKPTWMILLLCPAWFIPPGWSRLRRTSSRT